MFIRRFVYSMSTWCKILLRNHHWNSSMHCRSIATVRLMRYDGKKDIGTTNRFFSATIPILFRQHSASVPFAVPNPLVNLSTPTLQFYSKTWPNNFFGFILRKRIFPELIVVLTEFASNITFVCRHSVLDSFDWVVLGLEYLRNLTEL